MVTQIDRLEKKRPYWQAHVDGQAASGRTVAQYCKTHGINVSAFYRWKRELKHQRQHSSQADVFTELKVEATPPCDDSAAGQHTETPVEIVMEDGRTVRVWTGFDASVLERVLAIVGGSRLC